MKFIVLFFILSFSASLFKPQEYKGCFFKTAYAQAGPISKQYPMVNLLGNSPLYNVTVQEIVRLQSCFGVYPIFYFYDDREGNNAMATDEVSHANGPDGTVIFGKRLFNREFIRTYGGTTIPIVMAHEYAHIVDYKYGALQNVGSKRTELFADFLAGFYMYHRVANGIGTDISACVNSFRSVGDTDFGSENHHGTAEERAAALLGGYNKASELNMISAFIPLTRIIEEGKAYVADIEEDEDDVIIIK